MASVSSYLGLPVKVLTTFVEGSPFASFIKANLRSRGMDFEGVEVPQGGPWGYRHQINVADSGFGSRGPRVWNDRAGEVGRTLNAKDFDLDRIFGQEGVQIVHLSGLIAALSPETGHLSGSAVRKNSTTHSVRSALLPTFSSATRKTSSSASALKALRPAVRTSQPRSKASRR